MCVWQEHSGTVFAVLAFLCISATSTYRCCAAETELAARWLPVDGDGWTVLSPSTDTQLLFVSSVDGDDVTGQAYAPSDHVIGPNPFHSSGEVKPYRTIRAALKVAREGHPGWVLLRRSDVWHEGIGPPRNGRSQKEPANLL